MSCIKIYFDIKKYEKLKRIRQKVFNKKYKNNYKNDAENIIFNIKYSECRSVKMEFL